MQKKEAEELHNPVLLAEVIEFLAPEGGGLFIDATLGLGGHSEALLKESEKNNARLIGVDQDAEAISYAKERLKKFGSRFQLFHSNFSRIKDIWQQSGAERPNGILADLGVSSLQFDSAERGFSFRYDAPLDMRMNAAYKEEAESEEEEGEETETAADLLQRLSEEEIANVIYQYGEERFSRRIARRIVERRERGTPVRTTTELAELVSGAVKKSKRDQIHPATRTFQALRIAVNKELEILAEFIGDAIDILETGGRLAIISFHSLEDRIVKQTFQKLAGKCSCPPRLPKCMCGAEKKVEILTRRPVTPGEAEMAENPRARSAKLRVCSKL